ncbi:MAG: LysM peptidoglycan-binding domain-containing protein [Bacteroidales bacterium]|nr:LysM peptidoglycan-binding domain-containing protein [Bacteroidales bacterium]
MVETDGENLWDICQRFAVQQKEIEKLNGFDKKHVLREGDMILLRKVKDKK